MIKNALSLIKTQLNQHLRRSFQLNEDLAILTNLLEPDGSPVLHANQKVVMFLAGIEPIDSAQGGLGAETKDHTHGPSLDLVNCHLLVMCAANFSGDNYPEGLKFLYSTIQFFQKHPVLNRENTPSLDPQLDKLILSIDNKPVSELNNLWNIHNNGHYLPSVIYSVQVFGSPSEDRT